MGKARTEMSTATRALLKVVKPLTEREQRSATASAVKSLGGELSGSFRTFPPELRIEKPSQLDATPIRATAVLIFDYENRRTMEVVVDAEGRSVRRTDLTGYQPAFLPDEIQRAHELAEADERVVKEVRIAGVFSSAFNPASEEQSGARIVGLRYAVTDLQKDVRLIGEAVVDLSADKLVRFDEARRQEVH